MAPDAPADDEVRMLHKRLFFAFTSYDNEVVCSIHRSSSDGNAKAWNSCLANAVVSHNTMGFSY